MKKSIVLPIVAALMSVVVAVSAAVIVQDATDGNIWYRAKVFLGKNLEEYSSVVIINSLDEFKNYIHQDSYSEDSEYIKQSKKYGELFFKTKSLIMVMEEISCIGDTLALDRIYVENDILILNMFKVYEGFIPVHRTLTLIIEIKKADIENIVDNKLTVKNISATELPANIKRIVLKEEREFYR